MKRRSTLVSALIVVAFAVGLSFLLFRIADVMALLGWLGSAFISLIWGAVIAFIINVPMSAIERRLKKLDKKDRLKRARRPLSLLITLALLAGAIYLLLTMIIPELYRTLLTLLDRIPGVIAQIDTFLKGYDIDVMDMILGSTGAPKTGAELQQQLASAMNILINGLTFSTSFVAGIATNVMDVFFSVLFAIYILASKEKLSAQLRKLMYAFLPESRITKILSIGRLAHQTYSSFIAGQCTEALILGCMFFVCMTLFSMPYAMLISVFIGVMALIPLVGAWAGCIVGTLLILINDPMMAVWFVIMFLVLQQIEGNLIYPHVVGNSVGLKPIWTLAAVVIGQGLFGVMGMLVFIPLASILYTLLRGVTARRLRERDIPSDSIV